MELITYIINQQTKKINYHFVSNVRVLVNDDYHVYDVCTLWLILYVNMNLR